MYKLIIVDDERSICEGLADCYPWQDLGFEVAGIFFDAKSALNYIERFCVDVIVSDIRMPKMDGLEMAEFLSLNRPDITIVFLTGYAEFEYARKALRFGVKEYVLKPVDYDTILQVFTRIREGLDADRGIRIPDEISGGYYDTIVERVTAYLNDNYNNASLEAASLLVGLSPNYLSKIFKRKTGKNFSQYVLDVKMKKAAILLRDISLKTYEVADTIGYDNPKNFSRAFKQYFGKTPREFREQEQTNEKEILPH